MAAKKEKGNKRSGIAKENTTSKSPSPKKSIPKKILLFESLISGFSAALIATPEENLENELNSWLKKFVEFLDVDRCVVNEIIDDGKSVRRLLYYTVADIDILPAPEGYILPEGVIDELKKGIIIKAEKIPDDLPRSFRNGIIEKTKTKSVIIIPFSADNRVIGTLLFASFRKECKWSENLIRRIKLIAEIIANAIIRIRSHKALIELAEQRKQLEETYSSVIKNSNLGFMIIRLTDHAVVDVNDEYCRMSGYTREELIDKKTWEIDASMDPDKVEKEKTIALKEGAIHLISSHKRKDGSLFDVEVSSSLFGRKDYVYSFIRDITALNTVLKELEERLKFEELVSEFSNALINCKPDNIGGELNLLIKKLVEFFKVDRGVIVEYERAPNAVKILMSYTAADKIASPLQERYSISDSLMQEYDRGKSIRAEKISDKVPQEIYEWAITENIKSFVIIPIITENQVIGNITLASHSKERDWPDDLIKRIKLIGEITGNSILRMRSQKNLVKEIEHRENLEDTYSSVIKNANLGFMIFNYTEYKIIDVNDEYCRMSGYTRKELLDKKTWEIDASLDQDKVIKQGEMATEEGAIHFKTSHIRKDGSLFDVEISCKLFSKNSNMVYSFIRDITEINRTHKELEERLEFEELIAEFSASLITPDDYHKELNNWLKKFVHFLQVDRGVIIEHDVDSRSVNVLIQYSIPEIDISPLNQTYIVPAEEIEVFQKGMFLRAEKIPEDLPVILRGGLIEKENTKSVIIVPLSAGGRAIGSLTFATYREEHKWSDDMIRRVKLIGEITANVILRKRSRDALLKEMEQRRRLEEKYSSILRHANVGFMISDFSNFAIIDVNDEYCRITGYSRDELLTKKVWEIDESGDLEKVKLDRDTMMHQKGVIHFETSHITKDGNKIDVTISAHYFEADGVVCSFINNVTELKKAQRELEERLIFEKLISEFSAELINISPVNIFNELNKWLKKFVELLNVDRGIINEHLYDKNMVHLLINYSIPEIDIPLTYFHKTPSNVNEIFKKGLSVKAEKIPDDLPQGMRDGIVEKENVKSIVVVPIIGGNEILGNLTLMNYRNERRWPDDLVNQLKLIGEIIGNAFLRKRSHETLIREMEQRERVEERYSSIVKNANVGFWISDIEQNILDVNDEYCRMSGYSRDEIFAMKIPDIDMTFNKVDEEILNEILTKGAIHHEVIHKKKDGCLMDIAVSSTLNQKEKTLYSFMRDITELNQSKRDLDERLKFEEIISAFSTSLLNIRPDEIKDELKVWLKKFVDLMKVDMGLIIEYQIDQQNVHTLVHYTIPGLYIPIEQNHKTPIEIIDELRKGEIIHASKIPDDLPLIYRGGLFEKYNTKSVIIVPLITGDRVFGNITFASYQKERRWSDDIIKRIKLIGEIIGNAILRIRAHEALSQAQADLRERLEFEEVISEFSTALINIKPEDILSELEKWFVRFIKLMDADRFAVNEYSDDQKIIKNLIQYTVPEVDDIIPAVRITPEGEINALKNGIIKAEKIPEDLPKMLHGTSFEKSKAKSVVIIPLLTGNRVFGNLAITVFRKERKWSDELIRRIKLIGEIVGNAILRMRNHEALINEMEQRRFLEERYSSIIKTANVGFMISDLDANILEVNDAYCELSGYRRDELLTMKIHQLDISSDPETVEIAKGTMLRTGALHRETRHIRKDGKIINVLVSANLLPNEGIICAFIRDVTELKMAREDLEERLEFEKLTSEFSAVLINLNLDFIDKELNPWIQKYVEFLEVERGILNEYDYKNSRVNVIASYTVPYINVPPTDKSNEAPPLIMEKLTKGDVIRAEKIPEDLPDIFNDGIIRRHGTQSILIVPLSAENKIIGNLTFATYTKEHEWSDEFVRRIRLIGEIIANAILRKRASDQLIEEIKNRYMLEEKYSSIIKNASVGFMISDQNHNILSVNDEYCRMSGYNHNELIKMKISDIDYSTNPDKVDNDRKLTVESGLYHHQTRQIRKDGNIIDVEVNSQFSENEGFIFSFVRDVTELNKTRRDLEDKLKFEQLMSEFSAALINLKLADMREDFNPWIEKFVNFLGVERGIINEYDYAEKAFNVISAHTVPFIDVPQLNMSYKAPPFIMDILAKGDVIRAERIPDDLPPNFNVGLIMEHKTKSILIVPLSAENKIIGDITFISYTKEHKWSDEFVRGIKLIGEIIANAIMRKKSNDTLIAEMQHRQKLEERYASIIKTANVGFWISDTDQNILVVNDEYCRMSGYSRDELLTMKVADIDSSKNYEQIEMDGADSISRGSSHREKKHTRKDGTEFDVEISTNYLSGEGLFFCFTRDITELNLARKELLERLTFEELISEFSAALINVKINSIKPELDNWLRRFSELLNVDRWTTGQYEENYGIYRFICTYINPHLDPKPPEHPMVMVNDGRYGLEKYLIKGEILKLDNINDKFPEDLTLWQQLVRGDGTKSILMLPLMVGETLLGRMAIASFVHEKIWTDEIIRRLKLVAEIFANSLMREKKDTELDNYRKHLEKMVEERTARLEETQKELVINEKMATLGKLTATVSHELRNPLGTIRTSVFSLGKRLKGQDEKVTIALDRAERNIRRCDIIIDELLNYSRVQELMLEPASLDVWILEVLDETKPPSGIFVKTDLVTGITIGIDKERLRRSIINILTNAYQAIEEKGLDEPGSVIISTRKEDDKVVLEISDNGIGFDMAIKNKLFEPLFSTKAFGVGLGIPITKQIIEQHGFKMDMRGEPGKGASVIITIPLNNREDKNN